MLDFLPSPVRGLIAAMLLVLSTLAWCRLLLVFAIVKLLLPFRAIRAVVDRILNALATAWVACNSGWMRLTQGARWDVSGLDGFGSGLGKAWPLRARVRPNADFFEKWKVKIGIDPD